MGKMSISKNGLVAINRKGGVRCAAACFFGEWRWGENAEKGAVVSPGVHISVVGNAYFAASGELCEATVLQMVGVTGFYELQRLF